MEQIIRGYLQASEFAQSVDELRDAIAGVIHLLDCHGFAYLTLPPATSDTPFLMSNYDARWTAQYQERHYHLRDPVPREATRSRKLFGWTPDIVSKFDPAARDVFDEAEVFGIRCGVTVPLGLAGRTAAAMTFITDTKYSRFRSCFSRNNLAFQLLAQHSHERLQRIRQNNFTISSISLTRREHECLEWASRGKSRTDIALITGLSFRQVVRDLEHVKAKLGVRTTTQAVSMYVADKGNRGIF